MSGSTLRHAQGGRARGRRLHAQEQEDLGPYSLPGDAPADTSATPGAGSAGTESDAEATNLEAEPEVEDSRLAPERTTASTQPDANRPSQHALTESQLSQPSSSSSRLTSVPLFAASAGIFAAGAFGVQRLLRIRQRQAQPASTSPSSPSSIEALEAAVYGTSAVGSEESGASSPQHAGGTGFGILNVGQSLQNMRLQRQFKCAKSNRTNEPSDFAHTINCCARVTQAAP